MTRILSSLSEIAPDHDAILCDLWGCVHNGIAPYPAAVAALQAFRAGGGKVVLLTNAPRPNADVIAQIDRMGVPRDAWDAVVSSGDAAQDAMLAGAVGRRVWFIGSDKDLGFFDNIPADWVNKAPAIERVPLDEAEGIVCTGPYDELHETPEDYRARFLLAKTRGLKLLCANPDIVVDMGDRRIYCAGALAQLYTRMGGESLYFGKPHPPIYDLARRRLAALGLDEPRLLAVGDGIRTDIEGGLGEGIDTVFITGGLAAETFGPDVEHPDPAALERWLADQGRVPQYAMGRLR